MLNFEICFCFHFTKCDEQSEPWFDGPIQRWLEYLYYNCTAFQILNIKLLNADVSISFVLWRYNCCNKTCLLFTFCYHICINCDIFWEYLINFNPPFKDSTIFTLSPHLFFVFINVYINDDKSLWHFQRTFVFSFFFTIFLNKHTCTSLIIIVLS